MTSMSENRIEPEACRTMAEVRHAIDRLDEEIVARIGERFRYMEAAARIKPTRASVRDEVRKAQVIANVRRQAAVSRIPGDVVAELYDRLIEASIAYEFDHYDAIRVNAAAD